MLEVDTAFVDEQDVMDRKEKDILSANIGYLIGDDSYTNFQRTKEYAREGLLLVTPALHANGKEGQAYHSLGYITAPEFCLFPTLILDRLVS